MNYRNQENKHENIKKCSCCRSFFMLSELPNERTNGQTDEKGRGGVETTDAYERKKYCASCNKFVNTVTERATALFVKHAKLYFKRGREVIALAIEEDLTKFSKKTHAFRYARKRADGVKEKMTDHAIRQALRYVNKRLGYTVELTKSTR